MALPNAVIEGGAELGAGGDIVFGAVVFVWCARVLAVRTRNLGKHVLSANHVSQWRWWTTDAPPQLSLGTERRWWCGCCDD